MNLRRFTVKEDAKMGGHEIVQDTLTGRVTGGVKGTDVSHTLVFILIHCNVLRP